MSMWADIALVGGPLATVAAAGWAARSARSVQSTTSEAHRLRTHMETEPSQRAADLAAFREIKDDLERRIDRIENREKSTRELVASFAMYVTSLTGLMQESGIEPPRPPDRVTEYYRTGT